MNTQTKQWCVGQCYGVGNVLCAAVLDDKGRAVANCGVGASRESRDNARLIAAAPDLLEVARRVAEHFEHTDAPLGIAALAVIAKAQGEQ